MVNDLPTASITGQHDWEWNQWQAEQTARTESTAPADDRSAGRPSAHRTRQQRDQVVVPKREIQGLNDELDRRDQRVQHVIDHYEHLLAEKNRQLAARSDQNSESDGVSAAVASILSRIANPF